MQGPSGDVLKFNGNGKVLSKRELLKLYRKKGICLTCGIQLQQRVFLGLRPLTNENVFQGHCIRCNPMAVPQYLVREWELRNRTVTHVAAGPIVVPTSKRKKKTTTTIAPAQPTTRVTTTTTTNTNTHHNIIDSTIRVEAEEVGCLYPISERGGNSTSSSNSNCGSTSNLIQEQKQLHIQHQKLLQQQQMKEKQQRKQQQQINGKEKLQQSKQLAHTVHSTTSSFDPTSPPDAGRATASMHRSRLVQDGQTTAHARDDGGAPYTAVPPIRETTHCILSTTASATKTSTIRKNTHDCHNQNDVHFQTMDDTNHSTNHSYIEKAIGTRATSSSPLSSSSSSTFLYDPIPAPLSVSSRSEEDEYYDDDDADDDRNPPSPTAVQYDDDNSNEEEKEEEYDDYALDDHEQHRDHDYCHQQPKKNAEDGHLNENEETDFCYYDDDDITSLTAASTTVARRSQPDEEVIRDLQQTQVQVEELRELLHEVMIQNQQIQNQSQGQNVADPTGTNNNSNKNGRPPVSLSLGRAATSATHERATSPTHPSSPATIRRSTRTEPRPQGGNNSRTTNGSTTTSSSREECTNSQSHDIYNNNNNNNNNRIKARQRREQIALVHFDQSLQEQAPQRRRRLPEDYNDDDDDEYELGSSRQRDEEQPHSPIGTELHIPERIPGTRIVKNQKVVDTRQERREQEQLEYIYQQQHDHYNEQEQHNPQQQRASRQARRNQPIQQRQRPTPSEENKEETSIDDNYDRQYTNTSHHNSSTNSNNNRNTVEWALDRADECLMQRQPLPTSVAATLLSAASSRSDVHTKLRAMALLKHMLALEGTSHGSECVSLLQIDSERLTDAMKKILSHASSRDSVKNNLDLVQDACQLIWTFVVKKNQQIGSSSSICKHLLHDLVQILHQCNANIAAHRYSFDEDLYAAVTGALSAVTCLLRRRYQQERKKLKQQQHDRTQQQQKDTSMALCRNELEDIVSSAYQALHSGQFATASLTSILLILYNCCCLDVELLVQTGVIVVVLDIMGSRLSCPDVQEKGCAVLALLAGLDDLQINFCILMTDGVEKMRAATNRYPSNERLQMDVFKCFQHLASNDQECRTTLIEHGCIPYTVEYIELYLSSSSSSSSSSNEKVVESACACLQKLTIDLDPSCSTMLSGDFSDILIELLGKADSASLKGKCLGIMENMLYHTEANSNLVSVGAIPTVLAIGQIHAIDIPDLAESVLRVIRVLIPQNATMIADANGLDIVTNLILTLLEHKSVVLQGCLCLGALATSLTCETLRCDGAVDAIVLSMTAYHSDTTIQLEACRALELIAQSTGSGSNKRSTISTEEVMCVVHAMSRFASVRTVMDAACSTLYAFTTERTNRAVVNRCGSNVSEALLRAESQSEESYATVARQTLARLTGIIDA